MELGPYLKEIRLSRGHGTVGALAQYAKAIGVDISRESLRLFENEKKVPNPESRKILKHILRLDIHQVYRLEKLCAEAHLSSKYSLGPTLLVDSSSAIHLSSQIVSMVKQVLEEVLPIDEAASEEDIDTIIERVEEQCKTILDPSLLL